VIETSYTLIRDCELRTAAVASMTQARNSGIEGGDEMQTPVLIVNTDSRMRSALRGALEGAEYAVMEAADAESGLMTLRASQRGCVVLFDVMLFNNTLTGLDSVALLGAAAHDAELADQHAFVVITPTPASVEMVFGDLLKRIGAQVVAEPVDPANLRSMVSRAAERLLVTI
jgi:DNA-binding NtrC family response regulator